MNIGIDRARSLAAHTLKDKVSLVTGSTSGIGLGIARAFAAAGAARRPQRLRQAGGDRGDTSRRSSRISVCRSPIPPADMSKPELDRRDDRDDARHVRQARHPRQQCRHPACGAAAGISRRQMGRHPRHQPSAPPSTPRALALPCMIANKWGRIINIASAHGLVGSPFKSAYVAAKHGMLGLTKVTALETAEQGITCNAICPGYVYTPLVEAQIEGQAKAHGIPREQVIRDVLLAQQPNKRFATVEELGGIAVSSLATRRPPSPAPRCRSMAAGPRIERDKRRTAREANMTEDTKTLHAARSRQRRSATTTTARSCSCSKAAARSAPIRPASTRRCTRPASSRTGSSAPRSAPSTPASSPAISRRTVLPELKEFWRTGGARELLGRLSGLGRCRRCACLMDDPAKRHLRLLRAQSARLPRRACAARRRPCRLSTRPSRCARRSTSSSTSRSSIACQPRLTVGAAHVRTSMMHYFDSREMALTPSHVMASGALPPAFPAVRIDGELYWDGGILSNTPTEGIFDDNPRRNSLIFAVHMWNPTGDEPETIWQVLNRQKDIQYSSRIASHIVRQRRPTSFAT